MRIRPCAAIVFVGWLIAAPVEARQWTWITGEPVCEGELVHSFGSLATIRTADGKQTNYSLYDLTRADQLYAIEQRAARETVAADEPTKLEAEAFCDVRRWLKDQQPPLPIVVVSLKHVGSDAAAATKYGNLVIEEFETDEGSKLEIASIYPRIQGAMAKVDRDTGSPLMPPGGFLLKIPFVAPEKPVNKIHRIKGSFLMTTGKREDLLLPNVAKRRDCHWRDKRFEELGLKVIVNPSNNKLGFNFTNAHLLTVFKAEITGRYEFACDVEATDAQGRQYFPVNRSTVNGTYSLPFERPAPADAALRITLLRSPREVRVPFEFTDLEVRPSP